LVEHTSTGALRCMARHAVGVALGLALCAGGCTPKTNCDPVVSCPAHYTHKFCDASGVWNGADNPKCADPWWAVCVDKGDAGIRAYNAKYPNAPMELPKTTFFTIHYCVSDSRILGFIERILACFLALILALGLGFRARMNMVRKRKLGIYE
jgi:hypothetical protein